MLKFVMTDGDKEYGVIVRDDHPALIYNIERLGCREIWKPIIASIYPFHSEGTATEVMKQTVREHLASVASGNVDDGASSIS